MCNRMRKSVMRLATVRLSHHLHLFKSASVVFVLPMDFRKCLHVKARGEVYPGSETQRFPVPDEKVDWAVPWADYKPVNYTAPSLFRRPPWADPPYSDEGELDTPLKFNYLDGGVDRTSHIVSYNVVNGFPRNPCGRTGLRGRGLLGRWGPNHAADPIVTRWKREAGKTMTHSHSGKPVLQFVAIRRRDNEEWAIPGGMIDPGEKVSVTLRREFGEEALNSLQLPEAERQEMKLLINSLFQAGEMVFKGYVDDPRNTDNAWIETVAMNFHDEQGDSVGKLNLQAGDDAGAVKWMDINQRQKLYASHTTLIHQVAQMRNAHW
ncbi:ADP-ribose pyrophosphatase, mitochondrial-like isoform X1 [Scyliorhinus canicula]|uniref:ADP-ribose pyrophosphatase, mitochondrial-like isoform X1 n=2 Tax=Scyliorhinus canicula TaxID=7830 RepID=UPI0018F5ABBB|nr:ADP-ribose pyrophosphatase, mitochondrial-like isoform X1 [Scyliorhinus canicula]